MASELEGILVRGGFCLDCDTYWVGVKIPGSVDLIKCGFTEDEAHEKWKAMVAVLKGETIPNLNAGEQLVEALKLLGVAARVNPPGSRNAAMN